MPTSLPAEPGPPKSSATPMLDDAWRTDARAADVVFLGEIASIEESPGVWSGRLASYQTVHYRVLRLFKQGADALAATVAIDHPLLEGGRTVSKSAPQLDPDLFRIGHKLLICAKQKGGTLRALNADRAALLATDELVAEVNQAVR